MTDIAIKGMVCRHCVEAVEALVEAAKQVIIDHVRNHDCRFNLSACLQDHLNTDYSTLSKIFSATEGRTIEKYSIAQRVEFAKELLSYGEMTISEVADRAGYSSVAHLSRQFKTQTGMTPSQFQKLRPERIPLNDATSMGLRFPRAKICNRTPESCNIPVYQRYYLCIRNNNRKQRWNFHTLYTPC